MRLFKLVILLFPWVIISGQSEIDDITQALQERRYQQVVNMCNDLLSDKQYDPSLLKIRGIALQGLQDYEGALSSFIGAASIDTVDITLDFLTSECLEQLGDIPGAVSILENRYYKDTLNIYSIRNLARLHIKTNRYLNAFPYCMVLVDSFPDNFIFRKNLAVCTYQLGYLDIAFNNFRAAWNLNKRDLSIPVNLANCYIRMKEPQRAIDILKEGLTYDSININILKTAGYLYYLGEDYNNSVNCFSKAMAAGDSSEFVHKHLGISLFNLNRYEESIPELISFYHIDTLNSEATYYLGMAMVSWHLKDDGIGYLNRTIDLMTPDPVMIGSLWATIGQTRGDMNLNMESIEAYNIALGYDPDRPSYIYELARMHDVIGKLDKSADYYKNALSLFEKYIALEEPRVRRIMEERKLDADQIDAPGITYAKSRIKDIREELFFMGEIVK
jgi:tetratricopeptide (TPR) repeat protein